MIKLDIDDNLIIGKDWYVAFSGGPDSTCLLYLLMKKKEQIEMEKDIKIRLSAIHVNHNLRQNESVRDENFCKQFCEKNNINFLLFNVDVKKYAQSEKLTIEQAARILRYEIFDKYSDGCVFLGHNKDDNAETIFMNIIRGTGLQGLCGIDKITSHYYRPLLSYSKKQIIDFNQKNDIEYIIDSTNYSSHYMRNFIRNDIFPSINEKTGKNISNNLVSMSNLVRQAQKYIDKQIDLEFNKRVSIENNTAVINIYDFKFLDDVIATGVIRKAILHVKGILKDVEKKHIDIVKNLIANSQSGSIIDLKDGIKVLLLQNDRIKIFVEKKQDKNFCIDIDIEGITYVKEIDLLIKTGRCEYDKGEVFNEGWVILDYESVKKGLVIRKRMEKDLIYPYKGNGTKTLKKYFIDNKIDSDLRDKLFILAIENEIVYIENMEIGKNFLPKKNQKALRLEFLYECTV
ncbi:MAG TPA: tRNA lysidine(34) synthetase TilS [Clostridia bacterium]|nr:tRNA lysidine(34) synthetase TilS [Clostridia bacterium]